MLRAPNYFVSHQPPDSLIIIGSRLSIDKLPFNAISLSVEKIQAVHGGNIINAASNFWSEACCFYILFSELSASFVINLVLCQPTIQQQYIIHDFFIDCLHMRFLHQLLYREATIFAFSCYCCFFCFQESAAQTRIGLLPAIPRACIS